ncbi:MAG: hypothetical protein ACK45T_08350 [Pseudanabaena sp.]|jgi:hypothetical protein|uniref:hypothetical protein n=1 Tax=Pseudanabaena mucicola TaxID=71190 RepID=UPI0025786188|nr:hypothetical protein [Pseudanabaena mucicola]
MCIARPHPIRHAEHCQHDQVIPDVGNGDRRSEDSEPQRQRLSAHIGALCKHEIRAGQHDNQHSE